MTAFPSTLPQPSISGYSVAPNQAFIRTEMDSGPARQRQRFSSTPHLVTLNWTFTEAQMSTFKTFFDSTINYGTDWFTITLDCGGGATSYTARFSAAWKGALISPTVWGISATLEVESA